MSYESENYLPQESSMKDVLDSLSSLGYVRIKKPYFEGNGHIASFDWYDETDYRSWVGVYCSVRKDDSAIIVYTRTNFGRSYWDLVFQNKTIREIKKRFGGTFKTDKGMNRFLPPVGKPPIPTQSGCYLAFERFKSNIGRIHIYITNTTFPNKQLDKISRVIDAMNEFNPRLLSSNLLLPFLVSITEDYFKSVFICLLKYSDRKESFLKSGRITSDQLLRISDGELTVEEAMAEMLPFQSINSISKHFKALNPSLDLEYELKKPYRKRKITLFSSIEEIVTRRHNFIHRAQINTKFADKDVLKAIGDIEESVKRFNQLLVREYNWQPLYSYNF